MDSYVFCIIILYNLISVINCDYFTRLLDETTKSCRSLMKSTCRLTNYPSFTNNINCITNKIDELKDSCDDYYADAILSYLSTTCESDITKLCSDKLDNPYEVLNCLKYKWITPACGRAFKSLTSKSPPCANEAAKQCSKVFSIEEVIKCLDDSGIELSAECNLFITGYEVCSDTYYNDEDDHDNADITNDTTPDSKDVVDSGKDDDDYKKTSDKQTDITSDTIVNNDKDNNKDNEEEKSIDSNDLGTEDSTKVTTSNDKNDEDGDAHKSTNTEDINNSNDVTTQDSSKDTNDNNQDNDDNDQESTKSADSESYDGSNESPTDLITESTEVGKDDKNDSTTITENNNDDDNEDDKKVDNTKDSKDNEVELADTNRKLQSTDLSNICWSTSYRENYLSDDTYKDDAYQAPPETGRNFHPTKPSEIPVIFILFMILISVIFSLLIIYVIKNFWNKRKLLDSKGKYIPASTKDIDEDETNLIDELSDDNKSMSMRRLDAAASYENPFSSKSKRKNIYESFDYSSEEETLKQEYQEV